MNDLEVPDAALDHYVAIVTAGPPRYRDTDVPCVRAIAAPVVAAELRAHASTIEASAGVADGDGMFPTDAFAAACRAIAGDLQQRADELDPQ